MTHLLRESTTRNAVVAGVAALCVLFMATSHTAAAPSGDRFSIGFGNRFGGYSMNGRGQYGYNNGIRFGNYGNRQNSFPLYGTGPYGYGNSGYSGWNPNYNTYSPYNSNYYNPYSTWSYSPYGYGIQQSYGY